MIYLSVSGNDHRPCSVVDYTAVSENVPHEKRAEFHATLASLRIQITHIEERLVHYYYLLTEVYIERTIRIVGSPSLQTWQVLIVASQSRLRQ